jgi:hypothetical protein
MALNEAFVMCYIIDIQNDETNEELGNQIAITLVSKLHPIVSRCFF